MRVRSPWQREIRPTSLEVPHRLSRFGTSRLAVNQTTVAQLVGGCNQHVDCCTQSEGERGEHTDGLVVSDEDVAGLTGSDSGGDEGGTGKKRGQG